MFLCISCKLLDREAWLDSGSDVSETITRSWYCILPVTSYQEEHVSDGPPLGDAIELTPAALQQPLMIVSYSHHFMAMENGILILIP